MLCPLLTGLHQPHSPSPPHPCVQCERPSSAPLAGGSGLSASREEAIQELRAVRWRKAPWRTLGGSDTSPGTRGFHLIGVSSGVRGWAGSHDGVRCSLAAPSVPAADILLSSGKRCTRLHLAVARGAFIASVWCIILKSHNMISGDDNDDLVIRAALTPDAGPTHAVQPVSGYLFLSMKHILPATVQAFLHHKTLIVRRWLHLSH